MNREEFKKSVLLIFGDLDLKISVLEDEDEEECGGVGEHKYRGGGGRGIDQKMEAMERTTIETRETNNKEVC